MKRSLLGLILTLFVICISAAPVWDHPTCVRQGVNIEWRGSSAETQDGNVIYVWSDISSGNRDIYAQKFSLQGMPLWAAPVVIDNRPGLQESPQIIRTTVNTYLIIWVDLSTNPYGNICTQSINHNGNRLWQNDGVLICSTESYKRDIQLVAGPSGSNFIVWSDTRNANEDVYGQNINSSGNIQWTVGGKQLTFMPADENKPIAINDTSDGLMLGYQYRYAGQYLSFLMRYDHLGNMAWGIPVQIHQGMNNVYLESLIKYNNSSFVFSWSYYDGTIVNVASQRIDRDGNLVWLTPTILMPDNLSNSFYMIKSTKTSDSGIVVSWISVIQEPYREIICAQKLSPEGVLEWETGGVPISMESGTNYSSSPYQITNNQSGGAVFLWQDHSSYPSTIQIQNMSSTGSRLWSDNGIFVCNQQMYQVSLTLKILSNNINIAWQDQHNGSQGIYNQVYDFNGNMLLESNGISLISAISNDIDYYSVKVIHRSNDTVVFWRDYRLNDYHIYYQLVNADGVPLLQANGKLLTTGTRSTSGNFSAVLGENDQVAIVWEESFNDIHVIKGQLIDTDGNKLWGENGISISGNDSQYQQNPIISYDAGSYYAVWSKLIDTINYNHAVVGQRIVNGQLLWGDNGITLSNPNSAVIDIGNPVGSGRYFAWTQGTTEGQLLMVQLITPEGTPADGWPEYGRRVDEYPLSGLYQYDPIINSNDLGVFISWKDYRDEFISKLYAQHISPQGQLLWGDNSLPVSGSDIYSKNQIFGNNAILYLWVTFAETLQGLHSSKYNFTANPAWQDSQILSSENSYMFDYPIGCQFENGEYLVAALNYSSETLQLKYAYVDTNGNLVGSEGILNHNADIRATKPVIASDSQNAYIAWAEYSYHDFYASGRDEPPMDISGLYLQKMNNLPVSNDDPVIPSVSITLDQNYPNPFNPETTIKYFLPSPSDVKLEIFNIKGQLVKTLVNEKQTTGKFSVKWNGKDDSDKHVASGVYFYRLDTSQKSITKKMVLLK
jgi:hypothetical protein